LVPVGDRKIGGDERAAQESDVELHINEAQGCEVCCHLSRSVPEATPNLMEPPP